MVHSGASASIPSGDAAMLAARRKRAWETRRAKYGPCGHNGAYDRGPAMRGALRLVIQLHREGVLSEGQVAKATGLDRITIRRMADSIDEAPSGYGAAKRRNGLKEP